ncbi:hypothetical protein PPL_08412 [Heterostelium album PN500]|uniref:Transcription factor IIIC 90kDa subunit N-terminal domain-containing protein n=1 Tax=Heterostelium pallidum (strain ATCC 26659 / Pp 5 / PN500) TaxID=670386 RepID=D3BI44_HETP5|nr:hypothetical protein PPL_08412 [Heterostelium album PN500]EFA78944.1 hypothetical protein PPL_08412 [Heterostelium album PN500]|eukprot:XP_020431068.1 hypothetical protein PPL_08412 [Heterostelium album PN500]
MNLIKSKQSIKHSSSSFKCISNTHRSERDQFLITSSKSIFIFSPLNGSNLQQYSTAEITKEIDFQLDSAITYQSQSKMSVDPYFKEARFSPHLNSMNVSLIAASTNNLNLHIFLQPPLSSPTFQPNWVNQQSIQLKIYNHLKSTEFDNDDDDDCDEYQYKEQSFVIRESEIKEYQHRQRDLLDILCLDWSPRFKLVTNKNNNKNNNDNDNDNIEQTQKSNVTLLALGGKRILTLWKMNLEAHYSEPLENTIEHFATHKLGKGWCQHLRWKPTLSAGALPIIATATSRGEVTLYNIDHDTTMTPIATVCEADDSPVTLLEWSPPNESGESLLIIGKGIALQIYNPIKRSLTNYLINNTDNVSSVIFANANQFYCSSLDATIQRYTVSDRFWKTMDTTKDITIETINLPLEANDRAPDNYYFCLPSPNNLFLIVGENAQGIQKMYSVRRDFVNVNIYYNSDFENYQLGLIHKYNTNKNQLYRIWDTLAYQRYLTEDQLVEIIDTTIAELDRLQNKKNNQLADYYHFYKLFIYTYHIMKEQCPNKIIEQWNILCKLFISKVEMIYIVNVLSTFLTNMDHSMISKDEEISLLLMCDWLLEINSDNVISDKEKQISIAKQVYKKLEQSVPDPKRLPPREKCIFCQHNVPNKPLLSTVECVNGCPLARCQRTKLLLNTHQLFHCQMCRVKSLIFHKEAYLFDKEAQDDKSSTFKQFKAIEASPDIKGKASSCLYCGCTYTRRYPFE